MVRLESHSPDLRTRKGMALDFVKAARYPRGDPVGLRYVPFLRLDDPDTCLGLLTTNSLVQAVFQLHFAPDCKLVKMQLPRLSKNRRARVALD
jgi:hypothetical protein